LKKENMVKLPVIVYNHQDKTEVINSSLQLQKRLEQQAIEEEKNGGKYIRPIVLFQAQPKNGKDFSNDEEEKTNVQKLKEKLLELQIPEGQIKIKTANINEIKGIDLMSRDCEVRYIITINALKEGWDCPFAYILASLADKNSAVDVEQILGRVLRQPYVMKHKTPLLNMSYVLTASAKFLDTLDNIVKGLNKAGFSEKDYKLAETNSSAEIKKQDPLQQLVAFPTNETETQEDIASDIDITRISVSEDAPKSATIEEIEAVALQQSEELEQTILEIETTNISVLPTEIQKLVKTYKIKDTFNTDAGKIKLPRFYLKVSGSDIFGAKDDVLLDKENLLGDFQLSKCDTNIDFDNVDSELYKVDLDTDKKDNTPTFVKLDNDVREKLFTYILDPSKKDIRVKNLTNRIMVTIGNMYPIPDSETSKYISRILDDFNDDHFNDFGNNEHTYTDKIKNKIKSLSEEFAEKKFSEYLDTDKVLIKPSYEFPASISPSETAKDFPKSLYEKEAKMNTFEERVINEIANMENIAFWTRNVDRRGFGINGFINHYPDFIIQTKSGKTILLETKGDHLDAEKKIRLGNLWVSKAGNDYRYFLVYENRKVDGAYTLEEFLKRVRDI